MKPPTENDFPEVRRLLSLKRHEQPPPGYFDRFSRNVIAVLKEEQAERRKANRTDGVPVWIVQFVERLQARPMFAGSLGALACALVIGAVLLYEKDTQRPVAMPSLISEITPEVQAGPAADPVIAGIEPVSADGAATLIASNNLQYSPGPTLFDAVPGLETIPVDQRR